MGEKKERPFTSRSVMSYPKEKNLPRQTCGLRRGPFRKYSYSPGRAQVKKKLRENCCCRGVGKPERMSKEKETVVGLKTFAKSGLMGKPITPSFKNCTKKRKIGILVGGDIELNVPAIQTSRGSNKNGKSRGASPSLLA